MFEFNFHLVVAATVDPWKAPSAAGVGLATADPWSPVQHASKPLSSPPIGFNLPPVTNSSFGSSNGFNGTGSRFNNFTSPNQNDPSPVEEFDEFDLISNRNKIGVSPQPVNNGNHHYFDLKFCFFEKNNEC